MAQISEPELLNVQSQTQIPLVHVRVKSAIQFVDRARLAYRVIFRRSRQNTGASVRQGGLGCRKSPRMASILTIVPGQISKIGPPTCAWGWFLPWVECGAARNSRPALRFGTTTSGSSTESTLASDAPNKLSVRTGIAPTVHSWGPAAALQNGRSCTLHRHIRNGTGILEARPDPEHVVLPVCHNHCKPQRPCL